MSSSIVKESVVLSLWCGPDFKACRKMNEYVAYARNTESGCNSLLTLVKIVLASQHKRQPKQIFVKICWQSWKTPTRTWKCTRYTMQMTTRKRPFKNFCKLAKQAETIRNSAKRILVMITLSLGNSEINSIPEWRVFLLKVPMKWKIIAAYLKAFKKYSRMASSFLANLFFFLKILTFLYYAIRKVMR